MYQYDIGQRTVSIRARAMHAAMFIERVHTYDTSQLKEIFNSRYCGYEACIYTGNDLWSRTL